MLHQKRVPVMRSWGAGAAALLVAALCVAGCGGGGSTSPTTQAPVITAGPATADLSTARVRITWTTDVASNSIVHYGADTTYAYSAVDPTMVTSHSVWLLSGLVPDVPVHYRVNSSSANGDSVHSADAQFTPPHARIFFAPDTTRAFISAGQVSASLSVAAVSALFGASVTVLYDPTIVRCDSITPAIFLRTDGATVLTVFHVDNGGGVATVGITRTAPESGKDGSGTLASFHFTPLAQGVTTLTIRTSDLVFQDAGGYTMGNFAALQVVNGAITVAP